MLMLHLSDGVGMQMGSCMLSRLMVHEKQYEKATKRKFQSSGPARALGLLQAICIQQEMNVGDQFCQRSVQILHVTQSERKSLPHPSQPDSFSEREQSS